MLPSLDDSLRLAIAAIGQGCLYGLVGIGFSMIYNATRVINFAQGEFVMLGGVGAYLLMSALGLPLVAAIPLAVLLTGGAGLLLHRTVIRPLRRRAAPAFSYAFILFGVSVILSNAVLVAVGSEALTIPPFTAGPPLDIAGAAVQRQTLWLVGTAATATALLTVFWTRTRIGKAMRAAAMDPLAASLVGIPTERMVATAYGLSALFGSLAGALAAPMTLTGYNVGLPILVKGFVAAILGGFGNVFGAMLGGLFLALIEAFATYVISSAYRDVIAFVVMVAVLLALPHGLFGSRRSSTGEI